MPEDDSTTGTEGDRIAGGQDGEGQDAGDRLADGTDSNKPIPYSRFKDVNEKLRQKEQAFQEMQGKLSQYETYLTSPDVQQALQSFKASQADPDSSPDDTSDDFDPYDAKSFDDRVANVISRALDEKLKPLQSTVERQVWDKQLTDAQRRFGNRFDWTKDQQQVVQKMQQIPGLTIEEAFALVDYQRREAGGELGDVGIETGTGSAVAGQIRSNRSSDSLTEEEARVASRFEMKPEEYMKFKKEAEAITAGELRTA